jgi:23S rRNA pseudouridine1911/1915/1917 synthase
VPFLIRETTVNPGSPFLDARADRCVQELAGGSRSFVTGLFDHDCVMLNGKLEIDPGRKLAVGDHVHVRFEANRRYSPKRRPELQKHRGFSIVHEDRDIIVVDKSAELLTVPTDGREPHTLIYRVNEHVRHEGRGRGAFLIHRLDRGVSGLLVFGKTREMADTVQQQFSQRKPERQYDALVVGHVVQQEGEFRSYLATGKNLDRFSTMDEDDGELAITLYQVVRIFPRTSLCPPVTHVAVRLETGRRNQIRVHFAEAGHSVLGDSRYRPHLWKDIPWPHKRLALHASTLAFVHPTSGEMMRFSSPLPPEFTSFVRYILSPDRHKQPRRSESI